METQTPRDPDAPKEQGKRWNVPFLLASLGAIAGTGSAMWVAERWKRRALDRGEIIERLMRQSRDMQDRTTEQIEEMQRVTLETAEKVQTEAEKAQRGWDECLEKRKGDRRALRRALTTIEECVANHQECLAITQQAHGQIEACTATVQAAQPLLPKTDLQIARFLQDKKLEDLTEKEYAMLLKLLESTDPQVELILDAHPAIIDNFKEDLRRRILKRIFQNLEQYLQSQDWFGGKKITVVSDVDRIPYRRPDEKVFLNFVHATIYADGKKTPIWITMKFHRKVGHLMYGNQDILRFDPAGFEGGFYEIFGDLFPQEVAAKIQDLFEMWMANEALRK